ncbi:DUF2235 domain-containing protein [Oerskovia flava]|uniref:DUF2235 domain-containing protein n=1 Tax=Oerskovia flava TaxID=2986422 RepID=UPI00223F0308|nr:DUF2235 domain-containing protein [Oerskovia sp. JB1-3-2]
MKRLVLCCDGTWNSPVNPSVSNVEKIVRSVVSGVAPDGVQQLVFSVAGVGTQGYLVDRVLGGAFGYGLGRNVVAGYRHLALAYEPGDEIYVIGFSRGAYTARSVVGMIGVVGLLTPQALVTDRLDEAARIYADRTPARAERGAAFRAQHAYADVEITFLGVFDTVGALGVPGLTRRRSMWHDVRLGRSVACARQALAIDERRITYEPSLWSVEDDPARPDRVKQVWFPGAHSDVGGGAPRRALSDVALRWMVGEAQACGLVFHTDRVEAQLSHEETVGFALHPSLPFRLLNVVKRLRRRPRFRGDVRLLAGVPPREGDGYVEAVRLAESALLLGNDPAYARHAVNIAWWRDGVGGDLAPVVEPVPGVADDRRRFVPGGR